MEGATVPSVGPPPPPLPPRYGRSTTSTGTSNGGNSGTSNNHLGIMAFAFLSSAALFVAATFQAAAQRPSVLVRYDRTRHDDPLPPAAVYTGTRATWKKKTFWSPWKSADVNLNSPQPHRSIPL
jgi:hypothetical protein